MRRDALLYLTFNAKSFMDDCMAGRTPEDTESIMAMVVENSIPTDVGDLRELVEESPTLGDGLPASFDWASPNAEGLAAVRKNITDYLYVELLEHWLNKAEAEDFDHGLNIVEG